MNKLSGLTQLFYIFLIGTFLALAGCTSTPSNTAVIAQSTSKSVLNEKFRSNYTNALNDLEKNNYAQASSALASIMTENQGFAEGWANLALAQLKVGNIAQARQSANNALQLDRQSAAVENLLGLINVEDGAYKTAEQHYVRALELNPTQANTYYNLALLNDIYYQNKAKAIQYYERYLVLISRADPDTEAWVTELKSNLKKEIDR